MPYTYKYPMIYLTVDMIIFDISTADKKVLLIQRDRSPFEGEWAFPGGFVDIGETLEEAAGRELEEETSLKGIVLKQFKAFSTLDRDPRGRTVSVIFFGYVDDNNNEAQAGDDARNAQWFNLNELPILAFDHQEILQNLLISLTTNPKSETLNPIP